MANRRRRRREPELAPVGYAVVGLGHIAQAAVLPAFAGAAPGARLVALVSGDAEKQRALARRYGVSRVYSYGHFDECLRDPEVEAVYLALPNSMHAEFTERAARAGVHVLCEKPMATGADDCARMISACEEADVKLMIAYRLHFEEANLRAIDAVWRGAVGEPRIFESTFSYQVRAGNIRVRRDTGGGVLWDIGIYCLNAARHVFRAEPIEVFAFAAHGDDPRFRETEESVAAVLGFPDDRLASFSVSFGAASSSRFQVLGTKGKVELENAYNYEGDLSLRITSEGRTRERRVKEHDQFAPELVYFSRCIRTGERPEPDGYEGLADVRVLEALYESIETGRPIKLETVEKRLRPSLDQELHVPKVTEPPLVNAAPPVEG